MIQHPERWPLALLWLVIVGFLLYRGYQGAALPPTQRLLAATCKALALLLIGFCLLDPVSVRENPKKGANEVLILADNSLSLGIRETTDATAPTRGEQLRRALLNADNTEPEWLADLRKDFRVRIQAIDQRSRTIADASALSFDGTASRITAPVLAARNQQAATSTAAIVLLTDGLATDASSWAHVSHTAGAPVFPVIVGSTLRAPDLSLLDVSASQTAFEDSPVTVTAKVAHSGLQGKAITLSVIDDQGKTLASETQAPPASSDAARVFRIRVPVAKPGVSFLRVEASAKDLPEEATRMNNARLIAVDRGTGPYRVLYVGGRPNWDYKFLRRSLEADPEVQMPALLRIAKREPKFEWRGRPGESSNPLFTGFGARGGDGVQRYDQPVLIRLNTRDEKELVDGFPKTAEELFTEYAAIILDDIEAEFFSQEQMHLMERFVSLRGGSLLMLGGQESFGAGKYEHTPVGQMLPVYLDKLAAGPAFRDARYTLSREGWLEPWSRLRPEQPADEARMATMPSFHAVNQTFTIKPGASILATLEDKQQRTMPALVTQKFGNGRVLAFTIGDVWRWGMLDAEQQTDMQKHWRQLVRHLIVDVPDRVQLSAVIDEKEQARRIQIRVRDKSFTPQDDASVTLTLVHSPAPGSTSASPTTSTLTAEPSLKEPGLYEVTHHASAAGSYLVSTQVTEPDGNQLEAKSLGWTANPLADETKALAPDRAFLERLAQSTNGKVLALDQLGTLPSLVSQLKQPISERKVTPLWHHPLYLGAIVMLLVGEWLIRRRSGWI